MQQRLLLLLILTLQMRNLTLYLSTFIHSYQVTIRMVKLEVLVYPSLPLIMTFHQGEYLAYNNLDGICFELIFPDYFENYYPLNYSIY